MLEQKMRETQKSQRLIEKMARGIRILAEKVYGEKVDDTNYEDENDEKDQF